MDRLCGACAITDVIASGLDRAEMTMAQGSAPPSRVATMLRALRSASLIGIVGLSSIGQAGDIDANNQLLAAELKNVRGTLEDALKASEWLGKPISAKFAVERGVVHLSISIAKHDGFSEVVLYPAIRMINEIVEVTDNAELKIAVEQKLAMERASISLLSAAENAVKANVGSRAVSIFPTMEEGHPIAVVTVLRDGEFNIVTEELN